MSLWTIGEKSAPSSLRSLAAGPLSPPAPLRAARGSAPPSLASDQSAGRGWAIWKSDTRGSWEVAGERGSSAIRPGRAERAQSGGAGTVLAKREGAGGARAQGEARWKARVTRQREAEKFPARGAGRVGPARPLRVAVGRVLESFQSHESEAWHPGAAFLRRPRSPPSAPKPLRRDPTSLRAGTGPFRDPEALFLK